MGDWASFEPLEEHSRDVEARIEKLEQEVRRQGASLANILSTATQLADSVKKLSALVEAQGADMQDLKSERNVAAGLRDEKSGRVVGLTWPVYSHAAPVP